MAFAMAAPILHIDCDMSCCEVKVKACCEKAKTAEALNESSMRKQQCEHSQFIPIVSGPKSDKKSGKVDLGKPTCSMKTESLECLWSANSKTSSQALNSTAKFLVPLRL